MNFLIYLSVLINYGWKNAWMTFIDVTNLIWWTCNWKQICSSNINFLVSSNKLNCNFHLWSIIISKKHWSLKFHICHQLVFRFCFFINSRKLKSYRWSGGSCCERLWLFILQWVNIGNRRNWRTNLHHGTMSIADQSRRKYMLCKWRFCML